MSKNKGSTIEITMETEKFPGEMKTFLYRPFLNTITSKKSESPMFYLTERGHQDILFTVQPGTEDTETKFILNERAWFTKKDTETAARLIQEEIAKRIASVTSKETKH